MKCWQTSLWQFAELSKIFAEPVSKTTLSVCGGIPISIGAINLEKLISLKILLLYIKIQFQLDFHNFHFGHAFVLFLESCIKEKVQKRSTKKKSAL